MKRFTRIYALTVQYRASYNWRNTSRYCCSVGRPTIQNGEGKVNVFTELARFFRRDAAMEIPPNSIPDGEIRQQMSFSSTRQKKGRVPAAGELPKCTRRWWEPVIS